MISSEDRKLLLQFLVLGLVAASVMASYAVARPASESLFLDVYGSQNLPWAWLAVAITAFVTVTVYNRYSLHTALTKLFVYACGLSAISLIAILIPIYLFDAANGSISTSPWSFQNIWIFILYVWKDIYIVVLVEIFWSLANLVFPIRLARWTYGLFLIMGAVGGVAGNLGVGKLAKAISTELSLLAVLPLLLIGAGGTYWLSKHAKTFVPEPPKNTKPKFNDGFRRVLQSKYLFLMALLIAVVQIVITLIDYQYNQALEVAYPDKDTRTEIIGRVYALIDVGSLSLQLLTGPVLRYIGVSISLVAIPLILSTSVVGFLINPAFLFAAAMKVFSKVFDYSLFRAAKEILYIPLPYADKTQGKAVIDIMVYRTAKAGASVLLLGLGAAGGLALIGWLNLQLLVIWLLITVALVLLFRRQELGAKND